MTHPSTEQLRRLLHVIPRIADGVERSIDAAAARVGMSPEELLADLSALADRRNAPGGFVEQLQIYIDHDSVTALSPHFQRPMRLTPAELCALELGLEVLRATRPPDEHPSIDRAIERLQKVLAGLPDGARGAAGRSRGGSGRRSRSPLRHAALASPGDLAHLATLRKAIAERRKVRLCYRSGAASQPSERMVHPCSLVFSAGVWYVIAYCEQRRGLRFFRLDRIEGVERTDTPFDPPPEEAIQALCESKRAFYAPSPAMMTVRYSPRIARWIAEREGKPLAPDGSLTMEHPLADLHWAMRHVLQYGPDAEVLAPEHLRRAIAERLTEMAGEG
jgi:proteasome accessory factor C